MEFELESRDAYIRKYTDNVITGSIFSSGSSDMRGLIGSHVSGVFATLNSKNLSSYRFYQQFEYSAHSQNGYRYNLAVNNSKYIYDSIPPNIDEIYSINGGKIVLMCLTGNTSSIMPLVRFKYTFGGNSLGNSRRMLINQTSVSDNVWVHSFPFERRYINVTRSPGSFSNIGNKLFYHSASYNADAAIFERTGSSATGTPISSSFVTTTDSSFWGTVPTIVTGVNSQIQVQFILTGTYSLNYCVNFYNSLEEWGPPENPPNSQSFFASSSVGNGFYPPIGMYPTNPINELVIKAIYGFGDNTNGIMNSVMFVSSANFSKTTTNYTCSLGVVMRGWKYGLYSALPRSPKILYRIGKFGQHRDMLEQRIYTQEIDSKTNTLDSPIEISFISGTLAYLTYSNPTLNTTDSGIYDYFYRSGKPFDDSLTV